jgi:hypothetical protein
VFFEGIFNFLMDSGIPMGDMQSCSLRQLFEKLATDGRLDHAKLASHKVHFDQVPVTSSDSESFLVPNCPSEDWLLEDMKS